MTYEAKDNTGSLFKNKFKDKEGQPDYRGEVRITAPGDYKMSSWINIDKNGEKYMKIKFELKDGHQPAKRPDPISSGRSLKEDMNDDIPFAPEWRG